MHACESSMFSKAKKRAEGRCTKNCQWGHLSESRSRLVPSQSPGSRDNSLFLLVQKEKMGREKSVCRRERERERKGRKREREGRMGEALVPE